MNGTIKSRALLTAAERQAMFRLLSMNFEGVTPEQFAADLADKNWVLWLEDTPGHLCGFSTLLLYRSLAPGRPVGVACSGDTIIDREAWGTGELASTWLRAVLSLGGTLGTEELYWLLICSGYRTYRFLPVFWREFHPRFDAPDAPEAEAMIRKLATERWGCRYDPRSGLVRLSHPQMLRSGISPITPHRLRDPHVAFFARRNPGHGQGDELVCLTRIHHDNLSRAGLRTLRALEATSAVTAGAAR
jgi:hypothetical protein